MAAISKAKLVELEAKYGLTEDGLSYQKRCSRISAYEKGEPWNEEGTGTKQPRRGDLEMTGTQKATHDASRHPLFGKRILFTPLMAHDKNRALYFDEVVGHHKEVAEFDAGPALYGEPEEIDRMVGDYKTIREDRSKPVIAKTNIPKSGTEISWLIGKELVPTVRGNDGQRGYIWSMPTGLRQVGDTMIQVYGLKTLITSQYPELLPKFSGKPLMMYIDGFTLAASIPQTEALIKEARRREIQDGKLGLI